MSGKYKLYDFQRNVVNTVLDHLNKGGDRALIQAPIGAGKTPIAADIMYNYGNPKYVYIVNRTSLLSQSYKTLRDSGLRVAVIHNEIKEDTNGKRFNTNIHKADVIISMVNTFNNLMDEFPSEIIDKVNLVFFDEAHKATSEVYQNIRDFFGAKVIGMTATPHREKNDKGESLFEWYGTNIFSAVTISQLIKQKFLSQPNYFQMNEEDHVVKTWKSFMKDQKNRRTIVFARSTQHAIELERSFKSYGVNSALVVSNDDNIETGSQSYKERNRIFRDFKNKKIDVLVTINALCEGFDERMAKYCFICRSISSVALYHQMVGRVIRSQGNQKTNAYIVDFGNNISKFGFVEDYDWEEEYIENCYTGKSKYIDGNMVTPETWNKYQKIYHSCETCRHVYDVKKYHSCPHCGQKHNVKRSIDVGTLRGQLYEYALKSKKGREYLNGLNKNNNTKKTTTTADGFTRKHFKVFLDKIAYAKSKGCGLQFNKVSGIELFKSDNEFHDCFAWLEKVISMRFDDVKTQNKIIM